MGNGGFDAFMDAVTKILSRTDFSCRWKDYEVHILVEEKRTRLLSVLLLGSQTDLKLEE